MLSISLIALLIATTTAALNLAAAPHRAVAVTELEAPEVVKLLSFNDRQDDVVDEFRADFILKVPRGFVHPETGDLQPVNGLYLRIGYDFSAKSQNHLRYKKTLGQGQAGVNMWAQNVGEYYTVQKVFPSGKHDFLVISSEGDRNILDNVDANNIPGGLKTPMNLYVSYEPGLPTSTSAAWTTSARTSHQLDFYAYFGRNVARSISGPQLNIQYDTTASLWGNGQTSWGLALDHGANGWPPGIIPPNSLSADLVNNATRNASIEKGPTGGVSDSYWYAWVHEDGSLVTAVNTAPIRVTGVPPRAGGTSNVRLVSKNIGQIPTAPQFGWTAEQGAQGLTSRVGADGSIDLRDAGGTGFYRLLVWPEARDPHEPSADYGAQQVLYEAADLFDANGMMTAQADLMKFTPATVFNGYQLALPEPPVITVPEHNSWLPDPATLTISGSGTPGNTITLKFTGGTGITDFSDPALTTLADGEHAGAQPGDIVVDAAGLWSHTFTPEEPLNDGSYTFAATQTDQSAFGWHATSAVSNPQAETAPQQWGVTGMIDTVPPPAPAMVCPASPSAEGNSTVHGGDVEPGATVHVLVNGERVGEAEVSDGTWTFTFDPPLDNGDHALTAVQTDRAGNESAASYPTCQLRVAKPVVVTGAKLVTPVSIPAVGLEDIDGANWEVTATTGDTVHVLSGGDEVRIERDTDYLIGERLRTDPAPDPAALHYRGTGSPSCVDGAGSELQAPIFDAATGVLRISSDDAVAEPVSCTLTNQTAHVSLTTLRLGGQSTPPQAGWDVTLSTAGGDVTATLDSTGPSVAFLPGDATVSARLPTDISFVGIQTLDLGTPACAELAAQPEAAPRQCWRDVEATSQQGVRIEQGKHSALRIIGAAPVDLPQLPLTGGIGSLTYWIAGAGAIGLAGLAYLGRSLTRRRLTAPDRGSSSP